MVTYTFACEPESYDHQSFQDADPAVGAWIANQVNAGNQWAWCTLVVTATIESEDKTFGGIASIGGCSFANEADARRCYQADLEGEALESLHTELRTAFTRGAAAAAAIHALTHAALGVTAMKYEVHGVLASAYVGGRKSLKTVLTHVTDAEWNPLCKGVKPDNICDAMSGQPPSCPKCKSRLWRRLQWLIKYGLGAEEQAEIRTLLPGGQP